MAAALGSIPKSLVITCLETSALRAKLKNTFLIGMSVSNPNFSAHLS
jgi:hypothetical protein